MTLDQINEADKLGVQDEFLRCCGSTRWTELMTARRPFRNEEDLFHTAETVWKQLSSEDFLEAFSHHPKIGDAGSGRSAKSWAEKEQSGVNGASEKVLKELLERNKTYEQKFGFIFIVCATGKSADEMLAILNRRLKNARDAEIKTAAGEQNKITKIRLEKLLQRQGD